MLNGQPVTIPAESAGDVMARHRLIARDDVLDCSGENVAVVGEAGGEGRAVIEDVLGEMFGAVELGFEGVDFIPP